MIACDHLSTAIRTKFHFIYTPIQTMVISPNKTEEPITNPVPSSSQSEKLSY